MEHFLGQTSTGGGTFQKSLSATTADRLHTDQAVTSAIIWTPGALVYVNVDGVANANHFLLPANAFFTIPYENLNKIYLYNADASSVIVYCIYRYK